MDIEQARYNMVEQQIRPWNVSDDKVLQCMKETSRELFAPDEYAEIAYSDTTIPLAHGQFMLRPREEAHILQAVDLQPSETVLEIGTGSGYLTCLLAQLARHVYTVDLYEDFRDQAEDKVASLGLTNVTYEVGDAVNGWDKHAPYDVIIISGSLHSLPKHFFDLLHDKGRLIGVFGDEPAMHMSLYTKIDAKHISEKSLFETDILRLENAPEPEVFKF